MKVTIIDANFTQLGECRIVSLAAIRVDSVPMRDLELQNLPHDLLYSCIHAGVEAKLTITNYQKDTDDAIVLDFMRNTHVIGLEHLIALNLIRVPKQNFTGFAKLMWTLDPEQSNNMLNLTMVYQVTNDLVNRFGGVSTAEQQVYKMQCLLAARKWFQILPRRNQDYQFGDNL